jgi:predicted O-methyltransferase YrrM
MTLSARFAPNSGPATAFHRAVMLSRVAGARGPLPEVKAVRRALLEGARNGQGSGAERAALARVERRRAELPFEMATSGGQQFGFGPGPEPDANALASPAANGPAATLAAAWETCRWSSIPPLWGRFLFRLVRELQPTQCLELGTGLGLSALYQGSALELNGRGGLTTVDRNDAARLAERGFAATDLASRVTLAFGDIDELMPELGPRLAPVDYALLDAEHSESATVRHFNAVLPYLSARSVLVFDDITQTDEMKRAWRTIVANPRVAFHLAARRYGVVVVTDAAR